MLGRGWGWPLFGLRNRWIGEKGMTLYEYEMIDCLHATGIGYKNQAWH